MTDQATTTHLQNQLTAAIDHALAAGPTTPLGITNDVTRAVVATLEAHTTCRYCHPELDPPEMIVIWLGSRGLPVDFDAADDAGAAALVCPHPGCHQVGAGLWAVDRGDDDGEGAGWLCQTCENPVAIPTWLQAVYL